MVRMPQLYLMTAEPQLSEYALRVLKNCLTVVTCGRMILMCWKEPQAPLMSMWRVDVRGFMAHVNMLGRLCWKNGAVNGQWVQTI